MNNTTRWKWGVLFLLLLILAACTSEQEPEAPLLAEPALRIMLQDLPQGWGLVRAPQAAESDAFLVDIREPHEYATGFIEGAVNIPLQDLAKNLEGLPGLDGEIVLVGGDTTRSGLAYGVLRLFGYRNVQVLAGGMPAWRAVYYPVVGEPKPVLPAGPSPDVDAETVAAVDAYLSEHLPENWGIISSQDFEQRMEEGNVFLLDVREPEEYAQERLPNSINIPLRELGGRLELLPRDQTILVICGSGFRSSLAMMTLQMAGFPDVRNLGSGIGGLRHDQAAGLDIEPELDILLQELPDDWGLMEPEAVAASEALIVDVREPEEYATGFIEGAINIPIRELADTLTALPRLDQEIVVVCGSGVRSAIGMAALRLLGYEQVWSLTDGIAAWNESGRPLVTSPVPQPAMHDAPDIDPVRVAAVDVYLRERLPEKWGLVSYEAMAALQADFRIYPRVVVVDVREAVEVAEKSVVGAFNLPLRSLVSHLERVPFEMPISD